MPKKVKLPVFEGNPRMAKNLFIPSDVRPPELRIYNPRHKSDAVDGLPPLPGGMLFAQFRNGVRIVLGESLDVEVYDIRERACDLIARKTSYNPNSALWRRAREFNKRSAAERIKTLTTENYAFGPEVEFKCRLTWFAATQGAIKEFVNACVHIGSMHRITTEGVALGDREWFRIKLQPVRGSHESLGRKPRRP